MPRATNRLKLAGIAIVMLCLAAYGVFTWTTSGEPTALSQTTPEQQGGYLLPEWPPFVMIYKTAGPGISSGDVTYKPIETVRLEWKKLNDWKATTIAAETIDLGHEVFDRTGSWAQQLGTTYSDYDAALDHRHSFELGTYDVMTPPGIASPITLATFDLATRTDGDLARVLADLCTGDQCHIVSVGARSAKNTGSIGRQYSDDAISDIVFTNDAARIPIGSRNIEVLQLQISPTTPDADACHTNLREVIVSASLSMQQWNASCPSVNRSGALAHYYTFDIGEEQIVSIEAESSAVDVYLYLLSGASKTGSVIAENDDLSTDRPLASGIERSLSAGTYTAEVTTNQTGLQKGTFSLTVRSPMSTPIPIATTTPTPTPTPTPTATPVPLDGNPRSESVTGTSVRVSWDRLRDRELSGGDFVRDYRANYRESASAPWTFGNYVTSESFGNQRPQTTVPRETADPLQCNTQYEFQVEVQLSDGWHDYGEFTASTGAC